MTAASLALPPAVSVTLALVRHGESTYVAEGRFQGRHDPPLTTLGERQAALVAQRLAARDAGTPLPLPLTPPFAIWHSPLRRAATTASMIAQAQPVAVPLLDDAGLTEIGQGEWEGQLLGEVRARWSHELAAWRRHPHTANAPGGESLDEAAQRVNAGLATVLGKLATAAGEYVDRDPVPGYPGAAARTTSSAASEPWAVLVAHDGIFRLALLALLGIPLERFWSLPFSLCAITVVRIDDGLASLQAHNLAEHLAPLADEARAAAEARGERRGQL